MTGILSPAPSNSCDVVPAEPSSITATMSSVRYRNRLIAVLATTLLIGVVGRVAPQINTWTAGFGLHFLVLLGALLLSLGGIAYLVGDRLPTFVQRLLAFLA